MWLSPHCSCFSNVHPICRSVRKFKDKLLWLLFQIQSVKRLENRVNHQARSNNSRRIEEGNALIFLDSSFTNSSPIANGCLLSWAIPDQTSTQIAQCVGLTHGYDVTENIHTYKYSCGCAVYRMKLAKIWICAQKCEKSVGLLDIIVKMVNYPKNVILGLCLQNETKTFRVWKGREDRPITSAQEQITPAKSVVLQYFNPQNKRTIHVWWTSKKKEERHTPS